MNIISYETFIAQILIQKVLLKQTFDNYKYITYANVWETVEQ